MKMAGRRPVDLALLSLVVLTTACSALKVDLADLLRNREQLYPEQKRSFEVAGNPCNQPEKPFPCKTKNECIPMAYVCDNNIDCNDGYDENPDMCTAFNRPPVEDLMAFLESQSAWIVPSMFGGQSPVKIAHGLAVSQTVDDFRRRVGLSSKDAVNLRKALDAVRRNREEVLEKLFDMPPNAWGEVHFIFSRLLKSGFA